MEKREGDKTMSSDFAMRLGSEHRHSCSVSKVFATLGENLLSDESVRTCDHMCFQKISVCSSRSMTAYLKSTPCSSGKS